MTLGRDGKHTSEVFDGLIGRTVKAIEVNKQNGERNEIKFALDNGDLWVMNHSQDCCESVYIEDIVGDLEDLIDVPLNVACSVSCNDPASGDSGTWTFYKFGTTKGWVDVRWSGYSNGYYSEDVGFYKVDK